MTSVSPTSLGAGSPGKPVPFPRGEERAWFEWAAQSRLALTRCTACGAHSVARVVCPACWSTAVETVEGSGRGSVYSYTVLHRAGRPGFEADVPYVIAVVELDEGPRVMSNVVGVDPAAVTIGLRVRMVPEDRGEIVVPQFTADASA